MRDLKIFTNNIEKEALMQIYTLLDQEPFKDCKVRIMPDVHSGIGCVIGFTADLKDKVIPNVVGVDIGCGMLTLELGKINLNLIKLDEVIKKNIPSGFDVHKERKVRFEKLQELKCYRGLQDTKRLERSVGTLGGGNHFIEVDLDEDGNHYLIIHTGSRNLGKQVANYYQNLAIDLCSGKEEYFHEKNEIIAEHKKQGKRKEIQKALQKIKKKYEHLQPQIPKDLCYLEGKYREDYLHDMKICQEFAMENRKYIGDIICEEMQLKPLNRFETIHNYISFTDNIVRKGAISAHAGEKVLIPINMRDGCIIGIGKGNPDWNYSAPHGAGRIMSRQEAKKVLNLKDFQKVMAGIYTTSVNEKTLDEAPMVYKPIEEIIDNIHDTVEILKIIKPIYNFKAN